MFKVGDKIRIIGYKNWHPDAIKHYVGKTGTIVGIRPEIEGIGIFYNIKSVDPREYIPSLLGRSIELVDKQMVFNFMLE